MSSSGNNTVKEGSLGSGTRFSHTPDRHYLHPNANKRRRSPADFKRSPSPFELGDSVNLQIASSSAIIDKACVMDISTSDVKNVDEYINLFLTEYCVIDRACFEDVSEPNVRIVVVEEDEDEEKARIGNVRAAIKPIEEEEEIQVAEEQTQDNVDVVEQSSTVENTENSTDVVVSESTAETKDETNAESNSQPTTTESAPVVENTEKKAEEAAATTEEKKDEVKKIDDALNPDKDEDATTIESDIDSDFDNIEDIDPSWKIDPSNWQKVDDLSTIDLKPAPPLGPDGKPEKEKEKKKKEDDAGGDDEDSGYAEFYYVKSEKERDQEFQEYIRELCRPQIVSYLPDRCAPKGSDVRLTCTVKGNNVQARWMKDGNALEKSKKVQTRTDGEIHTLELSSVNEKDAGEYTAVFKNRAGEVETSSTVKVYDGKLHKPDHLDIAIIKDYYDYALGGLVIEAHVHGLPRPKVKFYKDNHMLHEKRNKIAFFVESIEGVYVFQCLLIRPDSSATGTYTILAENSSMKKRFDHHVNFETKYSSIHYPLIRHADKKLEDFVDLMLEKVPKPVEEKKGEEKTAEEPKAVEETKPTEEPKPAEEVKTETTELLEAVSSELTTVQQEGEVPTAVAPEKKKKHHHKSKHHSHHKKKVVEIDADLVDDGEEPEAAADPNEVDYDHYKRKFSTVEHEPYESETFRIYNSKQKLWFSGGLRNQTVFEGSKFKMFCTVSGPNPIVKWLKAGKPLSWSNVIRNLSGEGIGHVIFDKVTKADAGVYTCTATNGVTQCTTEATITVIPKVDIPTTPNSKPFFSSVLSESYHIVENDLILTAHVRAVPEPTIKWIKDDEEVKQDDRIQACILHDGKYQLRIHHPEESKDCGVYICEATNVVGKAFVKHTVTFKDHLKHTHPQYVYHKEDFNAPPFPKIELEKKKEEPVVVDKVVEKVVEVTESSEAQEGVEGEGNDNSATDTNAEPTEGEQKEKPREKRPKSSRRKRYEGPVEPLLIRDSTKRLSFDVTLRDFTAPAGTNIKLCCQIVGPGANVKWLKNGKPIEQSPKLRMPKRDGFGLLTIDKATSSDSGLYRCIASNSFNVIETEATVTIFDIEEVMVKPTFTRIKDYYSYETDDMVLEVQVRGTPMPTLTWKRDGVELDLANTDKFIIQREPNGVFKLCIHDPQKKDGGRFVVEASNKAGKEEVRQMIRILDKEHYTYMPGIYHADPKKPTEHTEKVEEVIPEPEPEPESDEPLMDKWGNVIPKKVKKVRLREKIFLPKSQEEEKTESLMIQKVRNHVEFESELKNCVARVGQKAKLLCTAVGPKVKLSWFKDDEPFEFDPPKVKNTTSGLFGSVTFLAIAEKDAGVYKCVASNDVCEASTECTVTVLPFENPNWIKPTFTRIIKEIYDGKTNNLILEVHVRGYPRPKLVWNKDGLDIEDGDEKYFATRHPDGVYRLNIYDPMIRDSGRYGCSAINEAGVVDLKHYLKVKPRDQYYHTAGLYHADPNQFAKAKEDEKKRLEFLFKRSRADFECDVPEVEPVVLEETPAPVREKAQPEAAEGEEGEKTEAPKASKYQLEFLTTLENQTGVENTTVKLLCQISGLKPEVIWLKNGEPLELKKNEEIKDKSTENVAALLFPKAKPDHSGEYTCIVKNRECRIESSCYLNILEVPKPKPVGIKPHYPFGMKHYFNSKTDELIIECVIRGTPRLFIKWYKDARVLENDDKYLMSRDGETYKLFVYKPTFRDAGIYLIQTENDYGMEFLKYVIEFEEKERPVVSGFIFHADVTKTKKYQDQQKERFKPITFESEPEPVTAEVIPKEPRVEQPKPVEEKKETTEEGTPKAEGTETTQSISGAIDKPLQVFRAHKVTEFRKNAEVPLEIIKRLLSSVVIAPKKLKLTCCVSEGDARIKAQWYKDGEPLVIDSRFNANATEDGMIVLEFKETMVEDTGRYKVVVKTKKGEVSSECDVKVFEGEDKKAVEDVPPTILKAVEDFYRPILKDMVIEVYFRGTPKPTLEWTFAKDGLPINPWKQYNKYQIKHEELNGHYKEQLIIANWKWIDNGKYLIRLENRAGVVELVHVLDFEGVAPEPKRESMATVFIQNEVPRVLPKPKEPTPPPKEPTPPPPPVEEPVEEEEEEEEEEDEEEEEEAAAAPSSEEVKAE